MIDSRMKLVMLILVGLALVSGCKSPFVKNDDSRQIRKKLDTGHKLLAKSKDKEALAAFREASELDPKCFPTHYEIIDSLIHSEMEEEAIPFIERAISIPPDSKSKHDLLEDKSRDSDFYTRFGDCYASLERIDKAEEKYQKAVDLNPDNAWAYNNWGYMYADLNIKQEKALMLAKKADKLNPENASILDSVGWAYFRLGKHEEAQKTLEKSVRLDPDSAEIRYHLGCIYDKLGYRDAAMIEYHKAIAISPGYEEPEECLKKYGKQP